jgi:beta-glucosidase
MRGSIKKEGALWFFDFYAALFSTKKTYNLKEDRIMKSVKFISLTVVTLLAYATVFAQSHDFSASGKVIIAGGQPVADATITYMNIGKRLSWDFSKTDGTFGGYPVHTVQPVQQNATITLLGEGPVSIDIFDLNGKKVGAVYNAKIEKGSYALEPITSKLSKSIYMLKIKAGDQVIYRKLVKAGIRSGSAVAYQLSSSNTPMVLAKKLAVIDSIRVGKTGYTTVYVPIQSYTDNVGNVTLTPVDIEGLVNAKFNQMTNLQRAGQLNMPITSSGALSPTALANANCGSVFGGGGALASLSASGAADMIDGFQNAMMATTLKIPILAAYDFVHGASAVPGATFFPHNLGMGAIQDTVLIQKAFRVTAFEVRGAGCNWGFGPCIAVIRDDRWGRAYEGFAETPELTQKMARNAVRGCQTTDLSLPTAYAACCKHFAGDGGTANGQDRGQTLGPDATARAIHLPGYTSAVAAGVATIMPSFSSWCDGVAMHQNSTLMTGWLKSTTAGPGFQGFLVGDWDAHSMPGSIDAGLDVPMASYGGIGYAGTINSSYTGTHVARFDDAVKRVLRVKAWMGMLDPAAKYLADRRLTALIGCAEHRDVARACVRASMVLLKNTNATLPMPKTANVAIWGTAGDNIGIQCGGWTVSWQGQVGGIPGDGGTTLRQGMQAVGTGGTISFVASPAAVGASDYIVAVVSEDPYAETTLPSIALVGSGKATTSNQNVITQVAAAHAAGKKVVGILIAGRPMDITALLPNCDAFVWASLPGSEGRGVAEMLYADQGYKFTGKLPVTWPNSVADEPINSGDGKTGLFAYGYGLSD